MRGPTIYSVRSTFDGDLWGYYPTLADVDEALKRFDLRAGYEVERHRVGDFPSRELACHLLEGSGWCAETEVIVRVEPDPDYEGRENGS